MYILGELKHNKAIAGIFVEEFLTYTSRKWMHPIGIKSIF
jgi:hypothetical protein